MLMNNLNQFKTVGPDLSWPLPIDRRNGTIPQNVLHNLLIRIIVPVHLRVVGLHEE
jgi:hypothetical protein